MTLFSSPELKAQVSFSDRLSSVVCLSVCKIFPILDFFSKTTGPISNKLDTKYPWVKGIKVCSNEGPRPFPRENNYEISKIHWWNKKIFFFRTTGPILTKLGTKLKYSLVKKIQVCSYEVLCFFPRGDNYEIVKYIDKM